MNEEEIRDFLSGLDREPGPTVKKVQFPRFDQADEPRMSRVRLSLDYLDDVHVDVSAELGRMTMTIRDFLGLDKGSVLGLERAAGETIDMVVNGVKVARGEMLVINDLFVVRIHSITPPQTPGAEKQP